MTLKFNALVPPFDATVGLEGEKGYVTLGTEQGITGKKLFEVPVEFFTRKAEATPPVPVFIERGRPEANVAAVGKGAGEPFTVVPPEGGQTNITTSGTGGTGAPINLSGGAGGTAGLAKTSSVGGEGGKVTYTGGAGAVAEVENAINKGGLGGATEFKGGEGGPTHAITNKKNTAGAGGKAILKGGEGGEASNSTLENIAGAGGEVTVEGGKAGTVNVAEVGPVQAVGGLVKIKGGSGSSTVATAKAGSVEIAGGAVAAGEEKNAGAILFKTGKTGTTLRLEITPEGSGKWAKAAGYFNVTPPTSQPATIKPEEITVKVAMERIDKVFKEYGLTA